MSGLAPVVGEMVGAGGMRLRTLRWEAAGATARVVAVHGLGEHAGRYDGLARALVPRGYAVLAYDQRGHGASGGRRGHVADFELFLDDLERASAEAELRLAGSGAPFLLGHSMGGLVVLRHLQTRRPPTPGAVLSAPWLVTRRQVPAWKRLVAAFLRSVAPALALPEPIPTEHLTRDEEEARAYASDPLVHRLITAGLWYEARAAQERALEVGIDPAVPTLVLVPGDDPVVDAARTLRWARERGGAHTEAVELAGRRHEPFHDLGRDEVFARVAAWLDGRRVQAAGGEPGGSARVFPRPNAAP